MLQWLFVRPYTYIRLMPRRVNYGLQILRSTSGGSLWAREMVSLKRKGGALSEYLNTSRKRRLTIRIYSRTVREIESQTFLLGRRYAACLYPVTHCIYNEDTYDLLYYTIRVHFTKGLPSRRAWTYGRTSGHYC